MDFYCYDVQNEQTQMSSQVSEVPLLMDWPSSGNQVSWQKNFQKLNHPKLKIIGFRVKHLAAPPKLG